MDTARPISISDILLDSETLIRDVMAGSDLLHLIVGDVSGHIKVCNGAVARSLGLTCDRLLDQPLAAYLVESDAAKFPKLITNNTRDLKSTFLLNFVNATNEPYTLVCRIDVRPEHFILVGEPTLTEELGFQIELNALRFLGTNMPHEDILQAVEEHRADLLGISTTMLIRLPQVRDLIGRVKGRFGKDAPRIVLGGGAFRNSPNLLTDLLAEGAALDVRSALDLCNRR